MTSIQNSNIENLINLEDNKSQIHELLHDNALDVMCEKEDNNNRSKIQDILNDKSIEKSILEEEYE
jgi:hypothetical protein